MLWYKVITLLFSHLIHVVMLSKMHLHHLKILIHFPACSFTEPLQFIAINKCYKLETSLSCKIFILNHSINDNCITLLLKETCYLVLKFSNIIMTINGEMENYFKRSDDAISWFQCFLLKRSCM